MIDRKQCLNVYRVRSRRREVPLSLSRDRVCEKVLSVRLRAEVSNITKVPTRVRIFGSFSDLPDYYDPLFQQSGTTNFFLSRPWFENFAATSLTDGDELTIVGLESGGAPPSGLSLFVGKQHRTKQSPLTLRAFSSLSNFYTMEFGPLVNRRDQEGFKLTIDSIAKELPSLDLISIGPLDPLSEPYRAMVMALQNAGFVVRSSFRFGNWREAIEGRSFDEYLRDRPSALRNTLRRRKQSLLRSAKVRFEIVTDEAGLSTGLTAYDAVYRASWKGEEAFPAFMPGLLRAAASSGSLRLGILYVDDAPAAAQIWLRSGGGVTIYKLAYDERFKSLSVGSLLTEHMMRHSIDVDRVEEVDFGSGDDGYKKDWMSTRVEKWDLSGYNTATARGLLAIASSGGKAAARSIVARIRSLRPTNAEAS